MTLVNITNYEEYELALAQLHEYKQKKELPPKMLVTALEEYEEQLMRMVDEE